MPLDRYTLIVPPEMARLRMDQALAQWLPQASGRPLSKAKVRQLIVAGAVYLNGKRARIASKELIVGARVEVHVDWRKLEAGASGASASAHRAALPLSAASILYEDDALIVVNKPAGLPTQPTLDEARSNLYGDLKAWLARREGCSIAEVYLGLHHRLDRDTSGAILFTKLKEANAGIAEQFKEHRIHKVYQALTERPTGGGAPREGGVWTERNYLGKVSSRGKAAMFGAVRSGGDLAITEFRALGVYPRGLWVEAKPQTGRTHQIRVHLSEAGMPILGDFLYGRRREGVPRLMLHAASLTLRHPLTQNEMQVVSPTPEDFEQCLASLSSSPKAG